MKATARYAHRLRMLYYYSLVRAPNLAKGYLSRNAVRAYWFRDVLNFGDLITPLLLKHYGFTAVHPPTHRANLVAAGSVLEHLPSTYAGSILGSGFMYEESRMEFRASRILAVRGALSLKRLGATHQTVLLGDPGLLAPRLMPRRERKRYLLGIIPHIVDIGSAPISEIVRRYDDSDKVKWIDVRQRPLQVFRQIDECAYVMSSSLHGLIVADSLEIPTLWLTSCGLTGGRFKFDDYYSSLGIEAPAPVQLVGSEVVEDLVAMTSLKSIYRIHELQNDLHRLWSSIVEFI